MNIYHSIVGKMIRSTVRNIIADIPVIYWPIARMFRSSNIVTKQTDLVIEGFPRSGNTFSCRAFRHAQIREYKIASHLHSTVQVKMACKWNIPCLVLIREPEDAIISYVLYEGDCDIGNLYKIYIKFYSEIENLQNKFVTVAFSDVINNFDIVIDRLNKKYNMNYSSFDHSKENVAECFSGMEKSMKERGTYHELRVSRPLEKRDKLKNRIQLNIEKNVNCELKKTASNIYKRYLDRVIRDN